MRGETLSGRSSMEREWLFQAARVGASIYRFNGLRIARRVFSHGSTHFLKRRFYGKTLHLNIDRGNPQKLLFLEGERFIEEREIVRRLVRPGLTAIDVGANIGYYALMLASFVGETGDVVCIEPDPDNLVELSRNIQCNRMANVAVLQAAAAADEGFAELRTGLNSHISAECGDLTVKTIKLDRFAKKRVGFVKVDVEGYELEVLRGARQLIAEQRPNLFVEVHPLHQSRTQVVELIQMLQGYYPSTVAFLKRKLALPAEIARRYFGLGGFDASPVDSGLAAHPDVFWIGCSREAGLWPVL